tara:strand:+ start:3470 stop:4135 length:666 start_codon:yes stop_codon:yes gene_type:complete
VNMSVRQIPHDVARPFVCRWHYSGIYPSAKNISFGCFAHYNSTSKQQDLFDGSLYAVATYGAGVNPHQGRFLSNLLSCAIHNKDVIELRRLCRVEPIIEGVNLTWFIARCHQHIKRYGYKLVVSFSDPAYGHSGGIYKAANFTHAGHTNSEWHVVDKDGKQRHRRVAYRHAKAHGISIGEARERLGLKRIRTVPKDRWLIALDRKTRKHLTQFSVARKATA